MTNLERDLDAMWERQRRLAGGALPDDQDRSERMDVPQEWLGPGSQEHPGREYLEAFERREVERKVAHADLERRKAREERAAAKRRADERKAKRNRNGGGR